MSDDSKARMQASRSTPCKVKKLRLSNKSAPHRSNSLPTPLPPPPPLHTKRSSLKRANTTELKRVRFGTVHIREHPIIPSDNPGGVKGPPVTIDWNHLGHSTAHVNDYEEMRPKRRTASQLIMPFTYRQELLRESGFTLREIQEYTKKANVARRQRKKTAELSHLSGFSETTEKLTRGLSNLTLKRGKKQKERALLKSVLLVDEKTRLESMELTEDTSMLDEEEDEEDDELIQSA